MANERTEGERRKKGKDKEATLERADFYAGWFH